MNEHEKPQIDFMHKLARQIVERRNLVFLFVILAAIFTVFSVRWVKVETDMTTYLPKTSETRMGLDIMDEQFTTYGSADVMVANITPAEADELSDRLTELKGVQMLDYDDTTDHYNKDAVSALYSITFDYPEDDDQCLEALDRVKEYLADYDIYVSTSLGNTQQETIDAEVRVIMVYVAVIIVIVLLLTSQTYAEVPVLILTFVVGMILNMGTNFMLGTISFVSNSVTNILQLALSLDYAIIFCNHFKEEHQTMPLKEAVIESLSKSIPEISSSSLTTVGGLVAMLFMQFRIGSDMAICLIKSILFAMLSVFVVMPGLLMLFGPYMDKTKHRNFVPEIPFVGRFAWRTRKVIPVIFLVVILIGYHFSNLCPYAYGYDVMMAKKIGEALGQKVQIVKLDWDSLIPAVMSGDVDCVIAGQSITAERAAQVDFSDPYYYASIVTLTKKDSAYANAASVADLAGATATSQLGTIWYDTCLPQIENANILPAQETAPAMLVALNSGACDIVVTDHPTGQAALTAYPDLVMLDFGGGDGDFQVSDEDINIGISMKKGNTALKDAINEVLATMTTDDYNTMMDEAISVQPLSE